MKIQGQGLRDHLRLVAPLLWLITGVWALRLVLYAAGAPLFLARICSVAVTTMVSILLAVLLIHNKKFGGYTNIVLMSFLLTFWGQFLVALALAFPIFTGRENIYTIAKHATELDPWTHVQAHLTVGIILGTIFGVAMGWLFFWILQKRGTSAKARH